MDKEADDKKEIMKEFLSVRHTSLILCYTVYVILLPFWDKIYANDTKRKQNKEEAKRTCDVMKNIYEEFGYQIVTVPHLKPEERAQCF